MKEIEVFNEAGLSMFVEEDELPSVLAEGWSPIDPKTPEARAERKRRNHEINKAVRERIRARQEGG